MHLFPACVGIENLFHFTVLFQRTSKHEYHFKEFGNGFDNESNKKVSIKNDTLWTFIRHLILFVC